MRKIFTLCLMISFLCLGAAWAAESQQAATKTAESTQTAASASTAPTTPAAGPSTQAKNDEETLDGRWGLGCSATTTCPASSWNPGGYTLSCRGDYDCYSIPGVAVVCDGYGTLCFF